MKSFIVKIKETVGIDSSTAAILANTFFNIFKGPISIIFIIRYLSSAEQGYWYTFLSLSALSVFAELGFTIVISQFVSHEFAKLSLNGGGEICGAKADVDRFFHLIRYSLKLYGFIVPLAFALLTTAGIIFFSKESKPEVLIAWIVFSFFGGANLLLSLCQSIYQGCDRVFQVQTNIMVNSTASTVLSWIFLAAGLGIWSLVLSALLSFFITGYLLYKLAPRFWREIAKSRPKSSFSWFKQLLTLQWKYALSWIAGYFIFRLFVPIVFKFEGASVAGQVGMTLALIGAIGSAAHSWGESKVPRINMAVANRNLPELRGIFVGSLIRGTVFYTLAGIVVVIALIYFKNIIALASRMAPPGVIACFFIAHIAMFLISSMARILRAHKEEPFYILSIWNAIGMTSIVFLTESRHGVTGMAVGMIVVEWFLVLPLAVMIFVKSVKRYFRDYYQSEGILIG